jgi:prophage antirepressor-like protein
VVLGYKRPGKAILDHCKCTGKFNINSSLNQGSIRGNPWHSIIPERDVYRLIIRSKLPEAEAFEEWVVGEVLPMIRKTGMYMNEDIYQKLMDDPKRLGQILLDYGKAKDELEKTRERLDEAIRTKAWISDKKTATAMGTASAAVRRERKIREELEEYKQKYEMSQMRTVASQMPTIRKYFKARNKWFPASLIGKELKAISEQMGLKIDQVPDERYGQVNRYHEDAFLELLDRAETLRLDNMSLIKYVKDSVVKEAVVGISVFFDITLGAIRFKRDDTCDHG